LCPVSLEATRSNKSSLDKSIIKSATVQVRTGVWIRESRGVATAELV
jgi:hypothetical protein